MNVQRHRPIAVVTSVELKAVETGEIIAAHLGIPISTATGLHEHERDVVPFDGTSMFHQRIKRFFSEPSSIVYGTESADAAHTRFYSALKSVLSNDPIGSLAVVTHGTVMSLLVARANGIDPFEFWTGLDLPSYVIVTRDSFRFIEMD